MIDLDALKNLKPSVDLLISKDYLTQIIQALEEVKEIMESSQEEDHIKNIRKDAKEWLNIYFKVVK